MASRSRAARLLRACLRRLRNRPWWPLALLVAAIVAFSPGLHRLDLLAFDLLAPGMGGSSRTVLVAIDDASIASLGHWPWPRAVHARMIERLAAAKASAVAFAVPLSEPDPGATQPDAGDRALAAALADYGRAVLPVAPVSRDESDEPSAAGNNAVTELGPLPLFRAAAARLGHVDLAFDADGVVRRLFLRGGARAELPALSVALAEQAQPGLVERPLPGLRAHVSAAAPTGAWQRDNEVLLPRARPNVETWSFANALRSQAFASAVDGRAVLIGVTARGVGPELALAGTHGAVPVVYFHALAQQAFENNAFITPWPAEVATLVTLALMVVALMLWPAGDTRWQQAAVAVSWLAAPALSWLLLHSVRIWWGPAPAALGLLAACGAWLVVRLSASTEAVQRARRDAKTTLDSIGDAVLSLDDDQHIAYLNASARALARNDEPLGKTLGEAFGFDPDSSQRLEAMVRHSLDAGEVVRLSDHLVLGEPDGEQNRAFSATISPLLTESGQPEGVVIALGDLTESVASARRLSHAATHDALTGLPNRSLLRDRLSHAIARALRSGSNTAVLFLDLDRFKRINDSLGHRLGDDVLRSTAQRLLATCRANDTVGRWGGDEFVVVLEDLGGREAVAIVANKIVAALSQPLTLDGIEVPCAGSVGIAMVPDDGTDADELLGMADAAMYRAKGQTGARFQFYSTDLNRWTRDRLALESDLRESLRRGEFELHYQPQMRLADSALLGFEALLRWRRPSGNLVLPAEFITAAEESGLIVEIGAWVLREAARQIADWSALGFAPLPVAVNVSARQCVDRQIVDIVRDALARTGIDPALLTIEITESTAMADAEHAVALFTELRALGVQISVDHFGTGYSSLALLKRFPIGEIKIDRSFIGDMISNVDDAAIVRATIALAHGLGLRVAAVGVETPTQHAFLASHDCDVAQGFRFGPAEPAPIAQSLLAAAVAKKS